MKTSKMPMTLMTVGVLALTAFSQSSTYWYNYNLGNWPYNYSQPSPATSLLVPWQYSEYGNKGIVFLGDLYQYIASSQGEGVAIGTNGFGINSGAKQNRSEPLQINPAGSSIIDPGYVRCLYGLVVGGSSNESLKYLFAINTSSPTTGDGRGINMWSECGSSTAGSKGGNIKMNCGWGYQGGRFGDILLLDECGGSVGIGKSVPDQNYKLDVAGSTLISGQVKAGSAVVTGSLDAGSVKTTSNADIQGSLTIGGGNQITGFISGTKVWNPSSVAANGGVQTTTITVSGASMGDPVVCGLSSLNLGGIILSGTVTAANTVTITLFNHTSTARDLASGTLKVGVWKI